MNNILLISNSIVCLSAFAGFIYGIVKFMSPKKAVYAQMITFAVGCMAFGRLYQVVRLLTVGSISGEFQLGIFGITGSLMFLFSANFGLMDSLADDGSKEYLKYRLIPLAAPAATALVYVLTFIAGDNSAFARIIAGIITVFVSIAAYFNLKHLIFPDVDFGVINCLKLYNLLALAFEALCIAELVASRYKSEAAGLIIEILMGAVLLIMTPAVERGIKKWTT